MIVSKLNKIILIVGLLILTQCYKEPFFELSVEIIDQDLNPVPNCLITIEITDVDNGNLISEEILEDVFSGTTNSGGSVDFSFENKAFVAVRACFSSEELTPTMCKEGHVYLEENEKKTLTLMIQPDGDCSYCF